MDDEAKNIIAKIFDGAGGMDAAIRWAKNNRSTFYTTMFTKLIPVQLNAKADITVVSGEEARRKLQSAFLALVTAEQSGQAGEVRSTPVIIDAERNREPVPQLVIPRKTG
jgi:hypothetical protein